MSDAKRYDVTEKYIGTGEYVGAMEESATGDWVAFSDYAPLKARLAEVEERIENARQFCLKRADHRYILGALHGIIEPEARAADSADEVQS